MRPSSIAWDFQSLIAFCISTAYLIYVFVGNESLFKSALAAIVFVIFMYITLEANIEAEKARMREEQA